MDSSLNIHWKIRLHHARAMRDALVACGNPAPASPDRPGSLVQIEARVFNGKIAIPFIESRGHSSWELSKCACLNLDPEKLPE